MSTERLPGLRLAIAALLSVLVAFVAQGSASAESGQIRLVLQPVGQAGSFFDLSMLPGERRRLAVDIANDGDAPLAARTYAANVYTIINGGFGARLRDEAETGTTRWLDYPTTVLQLARGERVRLTFMVFVPAGTGPGEYVTSLVLENEQPLQGSGAVGLSQVIRQAVAVVVTVPGQRSPGLAIGTASHKVVTGRSVVSVAVENTGNVRLKPLVTFALLDASGDQVSQATLQMDTFYARTETYIEVQLAAMLLPGSYTVRLTLRDAAQGAQAREVAIPLTVEAAAEPTGAGAVVPRLPGVKQTLDGGPPAPWTIALFAGLLLATALGSLLLVVRARRAPGPAER